MGEARRQRRRKARDLARRGTSFAKSLASEVMGKPVFVDGKRHKPPRPSDLIDAYKAVGRSIEDAGAAMGTLVLPRPAKRRLGSFYLQGEWRD